MAEGLKAIACVGLGGALGSTLRYLLGAMIQRALAGGLYAKLPLATFAVNIIGCLGIGLLAAWTEGRTDLSPAQRLFIFTGLLGGFTTFSTYAHEGQQLLREGLFPQAAIYILGQVILGLAAVWLGYALMRWAH